MATMISTQPRQVLTPLSPKRRTVLGNVTNIVHRFDNATTQDGKGLSFSKPSLAKKSLGLTLSTANTSKRPFYTVYDENSTTQTKRMKSQTSAVSCEENTIPKYALVTKPVSAVPSGIVVSKKKTGLVNATQTSLKRRTHVPSLSSASPIGSSGRSAAHASAISRKDSLATLTSTSPSNGIKRKIQKSVRRVEPPANLSKSGNDIDSTIDGRLIATPVAKSGNTTGSTWRPGQTFPKSWMFDIHEDTLEETLTNLMYHGAGVLDISDEEDLKKKSMSEVDRVGKENIPPPPSEDQLAMPPPPAPTREEEADMDAERSRNPLGDVDVEVFYPNLKKEREEAEQLKLMKQEEKKNGMMQSKFAVIDNIVSDYMKQKKDDSEAVSAAEVPLPNDDDEDNFDEEVQATAGDEVADVKKSTDAPKISVENCDFDAVIDSQSRSMAEDELFDDDL